MTQQVQWLTWDSLFPLILATLLSLHGLQKRSLSPGGALTAFIVGWAMMGMKVRAFGIVLIVFYLVGSRATKYGKERKKKLEDGYEEGGYRTGWQVLCNSLWALAAGTVWTSLFVPRSLPSVIMQHGDRGVAYDGSWCPLDGNVGWSRGLVLAMLAHFSCCLGDTLASELGILSGSKPILITTLKPVPPGTNGGVSLGGTLASAVGGLIIGAAAAGSLLLQCGACAAMQTITTCLIAGSLFGVGGSMVDSFLGATIQQTRYSEERRRIVNTGGAVVGGLNILSNNGVNMTSSLICALIALFAL